MSAVRKTGRSYREKRDFARTPEPEPKEGSPASAGGAAPIFVVQEHHARRLHYDLRLEVDGVLKSWALPKGPPEDPDVKRLAVMVEDHPLEYASFKGTIPQGEYGAGEVRIWDRGTYFAGEGRIVLKDRRRSEQAMREGIAAGKVTFLLNGRRLKGSWTLVRTRRNKGKENWLLIKHRNEWVPPDAADQAKSAPGSPGRRNREPPGAVDAGPRRERAASLADLPEKRPAPLPSFIPPMLAMPASSPPPHQVGRDWFWEPKLDGYRVLALVRGGKVSLLSRNARDVTARYPEIARQLAAQRASNLALDGEIVALDEAGRPCFQCLQHLQGSLLHADSHHGASVVYYVFDIVYLDGYGLENVPLQHRKALLKDTLQPSDAIRLIEHFTGDARVIFRSAVDTGFEGVVGKMRDSIYEPGVRSRSWIKIKAVLSDDFVVGGFTRGTGSRGRTFGSLLLGQYDDKGRLVYTGLVGSGFDDSMLTGLRRQLDALQAEQSPFASVPRLGTPSTWVRPELVVEVKFDQRTSDGYLRIPVFLRVRQDKPAGEAKLVRQRRGRATAGFKPDRPESPENVIGSVLEQLENPKDSFALDILGQKIELTNLGKVLWPSPTHPVTKRDLLVYLATVSPHILRHTLDRPLTMTRYPDGINGSHFYQKHLAEPLPKFAESARLYSRSEGWQQYLLCQNLTTLLWMGQMANLEFHVWFSRVTSLPDGDDLRPFVGSVAKSADFHAGYPDFIVFDLDPYIFSGHEAKGAEPELNRQAYAMTCKVALWLKELLDGLSLPSVVKTSGRTGLHVYVPIRRHFSFDVVRRGAATIASRLLEEHPKDITIEWAVAKRAGKIFIDFNQNVRGKTLACAYSPRPAPDATVSMPLDWKEIRRVFPTDFTILTAPSRLAEIGDLWQDIMAAKSDLRGALGLAQ